MRASTENLAGLAREAQRIASALAQLRQAVSATGPSNSSPEPSPVSLVDRLTQTIDSTEALSNALHDIADAESEVLFDATQAERMHPPEDK